jgi:hypothetical protein
MEIWLFYLIHFAIALIVGGLFCIGLWLSSRGADSVKPNGEETTDWGMIFYPITRLLSKKTKYTIYYEGDEFVKLWHDIKCDFKQHIDLINDVDFARSRGQYDYSVLLILGNEEEEKINIALWKMLICDIEKRYKIKGELIGREMKFYEEFEKPVYGSWTKPLLLCFKCYASFWGTIIFTLVTLFSIRTNLIPIDFYVLIPMWIIYVFSLVVVNVYLEKKVQ